MLKFDEHGVPTIRSSIPMSLFGLGLFLGVFLRPVGVASYFMAAIRGVDEMGEFLPSDWRLMVGVVGGLLLVETVLFIAAAWFYFQRRKEARSLIILALLASIATSIIEAGWSVALANGDNELIAQSILPAVPSCLVAIAWVLYFLLSKRVRATLVYPLTTA